MTDSLEQLRDFLKGLPGLGPRSAERIALHLVLAGNGELKHLTHLLNSVDNTVTRCPRCGNIAEAGELCAVCADASRNRSVLCVVESVQDLIAIEKSGAWKGRYHVLHGRLSPLRGIGPEQLNLQNLNSRIEAEGIDELVFALPNEVEAEATCHYLMDQLLAHHQLKLSRIGFGLPSGGEVTFADALTLRTALDGRKEFRR
jgi:recombination protein RecR